MQEKLVCGEQEEIEWVERKGKRQSKLAYLGPSPLPPGTAAVSCDCQDAAQPQQLDWGHHQAAAAPAKTAE